MTNPQVYAVQIEHIMCRVFDCERLGIGGLVNSDYARKNPFTAMMSTLTHLYKNGNIQTEKAVAEFFDRYSYYGDWSIDELLSFDGDSKIINGATYEIGYRNGEEALTTMIDSFSTLCEQYK